ncbi:hypothetical protein E4U43_000861 [Claviceps pusilla]|uniref:Uncharacterized protein n=1 Tax=Claviceps pusilla TaxID=123648 RepID=A0A9P7SZT0_9HYPO|nr:hypothetical protein E4U43_000861 [Claviceps pusilla]
MVNQDVESPTGGRKTALVTGSGIGGIGGSLATELHNAGYFVFCAVRKPSAIDDLLQPGMMAVELDVQSTESVAAAVKTVSAVADGRLDVLINNAGFATHRPALDLDVDGVVASMFDVNVLGVMRMVKAFSDLLINAKGCIVNIGSVAPIMPLVYSSAYNATKAALHAYGDSLHMELKPLGVDVLTIITGGVKSNIGKEPHLHSCRLLKSHYFVIMLMRPRMRTVRETNASLPENSRYLPVKDYWLRRVTLSQEGAMQTDEYARGVVRAIEKKKRPLWLWRGGSAWLCFFLYYLTPRRLRLYMMARRFGLHSLTS